MSSGSVAVEPVAHKAAAMATAAASAAGEKCNGASEATDDVKATRQHIKNIEAELSHSRDAVSGTILCSSAFSRGSTHLYVLEELSTLISSIN